MNFRDNGRRSYVIRENDIRDFGGIPYGVYTYTLIEMFLIKKIILIILDKKIGKKLV